MKRALIPLLGFLPVACAVPAASTDPLVNAVARYGLACDAYASSLNVLAVFRAANQLDQRTVADVNKLVAVAGPICEAGAPPADNLALLVALERAVIDLVALRKEATNVQ